MKDSAAPKRKAVMLILKNLIILLVIVVAAFVGARSWFTSSTTAYANGLSVRAKESDKLEIAVVPHGAGVPAMDSEAWMGASIALTPENYPSIFANLYMSDIDGGRLTGTGASTEMLFYKPFMTQTGLIAHPDAAKISQWETATANTDFLCVDIYARTARSSDNVGVKLCSTSKIAPESAFANGIFSEDGVIGAVRFGFLSNTASGSAMKVWIPAPQVHYNDVSKVMNIVSPDADISLPCGDTGKGNVHYYYDEDGTVAEFGSANTICSGDDYTLGEDIEFIRLGNTLSDYKYGHTTCYLWIEGEDTEARLVTVGGHFTASLDFVTYD